ncbi:MAG: N-glycosylase/DNA lyase [Candidatus Thermoplasmatota archaeon]|jgi:N-glycosylase/DNA lyase|nr:N-glycosylase/DNA lyase [Candidatus Thermoplasmatota archaeon]
MQKLVEEIKSLKNSEIGKTINNRINEFKELNKKSDEEIFKELCFCILTANYNAEKTIKIQNEIGECFLKDPEETLAKKLREYGHRYPDTRAKYIKESCKSKDLLMKAIKTNNGNNLRDWIVNNIKGLGYKEASHFLRNIGFDDFAIIDFHIIDILVKYNLITKPKTLTRRKYLEIENILKTLGEKTDTTLAELDLYLWYLETGKILK